MQNKYCLPIIAESWQKVIDTIESQQANYGYFEVWLDYLTDLETHKLIEFVSEQPSKLILVFRRQNLEPIKMTAEQRFKIFDALASKNCLVDVDISQTEDLDYLKSKDIKKIVSFHDYQKTPSAADLQTKVTEIENYEPDIIKISTFCNSPEDAVRLLSLQQEFIKKSIKHIVLGMGEHGQATRIFGTLWGNELAFVPEEDETKSAAGQINRAKFERIMKELTDAR